jgi:hypothetical protein
MSPHLWNVAIGACADDIPTNKTTDLGVAFLRQFSTNDDGILFRAFVGSK